MATSDRYRMFRLRTDHEFRGVLDAASIVIARNIINESPDTENHQQRLALANLMMGETTPDRQRAIGAWALAGILNPVILASAFPGESLDPDVSGITDNDCDFLIASEWPNVAAMIFPGMEDPVAETA